MAGAGKKRVFAREHAVGQNWPSWYPPGRSLLEAGLLGPVSDCVSNPYCLVTAADRLWFAQLRIRMGTLWARNLTKPSKPVIGSAPEVALVFSGSGSACP